MRTDMVILGAYEGDISISPVKRTRAYMLQLISDYLRSSDPPDVVYNRGLLKDLEEYNGYRDYKEMMHEKQVEMIIYLNRKRNRRKVHTTSWLSDMLNRGEIRMQEYMYIMRK